MRSVLRHRFDTDLQADRGSDPECAPGVPSRGVVAGVIGAVGVLVLATCVGLAGESRGLLLLDIGTGLLSLALLPLLLARPAPGALVLAALAVVSPTATPAATVGTLHVAQRRPLRTALLVGAAGAAGHLLRYAWRPVGGLSFWWWLVLVVAVHAGLVAWGAFSQARRAVLVSLAERARRAEAEQGRRVAEARTAERARIAREMHDILGHRLSIVAAYAGALEYRPDSSPEQQAKAAGVIREGIGEALAELREVVAVLREDSEATDGDGPGLTGDDGPDRRVGEAAARPQPGWADLARLVEECRSAGMRIHHEDTVPRRPPVPAGTARTVYRIVQEGLTNARKHAPGRPVTVTLRGAPGDGIRVEVSNPATCPVAVTVAAGGVGLVGLGERVDLAGGSMATTCDDGTFTLSARLPWSV